MPVELRPFVAVGKGLEPLSPGPEPGVLPLDDPTNPSNHRASAIPESRNVVDQRASKAAAVRTWAVFSPNCLAIFSRAESFGQPFGDDRPWGRPRPHGRPGVARLQSGTILSTLPTPSSQLYKSPSKAVD